LPPAGKVLVDDRPVIKAGTPVPATARVVITAQAPKYVCRAGLKLEAALRHFGVDVAGLSALDAGLSTGGFTDCLLQHGAASVVGVDVGYGQVAERVRVDPRVTVMERTNLRHLRADALPGGRRVDLVTLDLSFISMLKVTDAVSDLLAPGGRVVALVKPQFEAGRAQVGAGGVVRDPGVHAEVLARVGAGWAEAGFESGGWMESPIKGATAGNTEFLAHYFRRGGAAAAAAAAAGGGGGGLAPARALRAGRVLL
jgi:23S rRNA (cytidine1920-2'-O)/16S rRNA (cytidine1409-2'-O)-methyltransferase